MEAWGTSRTSLPRWSVVALPRDNGLHNLQWLMLIGIPVRCGLMARWDPCQISRRGSHQGVPTIHQFVSPGRRLSVECCHETAQGGNPPLGGGGGGDRAGEGPPGVSSDSLPPWAASPTSHHCWARRTSRMSCAPAPFRPCQSVPNNRGRDRRELTAAF